MTAFNSHLNVVNWVSGWLGLMELMFLCTWRPQGRCSSSRFYPFCKTPFVTCVHYFVERFDDLVSSVNGWAFPHTVRLVCVCDYLETMGGLLPENTFFTGPNPPSSIHIPPPAESLSVTFENRTLTSVFNHHPVTPVESMKNCSSALVLCGASLPRGFFFFFLPLWTVRCWHHIALQMFPEECVLLAVVSAVGLYVSQSIPKLALIPAAFY